ncbi:MAG: endo-1,4-beta-xylanase [Chitinophagaceae bacterium]
MLQKLTLILSLAALSIAGCTASKKTGALSTIPSLKDAFKNDFKIGTAMNTRQIEEKDAAAAMLIPQQFNTVTPENSMKAAIIHPGWDQYNFDLADKLVAYGEKNHLQINAHTLIWHSQLPMFMRRIKSPDSVRLYMTNHIATVAARYDGKVYSWDVVNEALNEDGSMRKSIFQQNLGDDFVVEAFRLAQQAAPHSKLYYNDYNIEQPKKRAGAIALIKKIQAAGVRIDGVGIQGHWRAYDLPLKDIEQSIQEFSALGIEVMFTELDLSVLRNAGAVTADVNQTSSGDNSNNPYTEGVPDAVQTQLSTAYESLFRLLVKYKKNISRVTFWGVNDGQSWLNDFPVRGRTNYPLLFNRQFKPKPAFYSVIKTAQ